MRVAILGAGPAGMSCANACLTFGLSPMVVERSDHVGGAQRVNFHPNLWLLGAPPSESGEALTQRLAAHFLELPLALHRPAEVIAVVPGDGGFRLTLKTPAGELQEAVRAIVLATGMQPRSTPELDALARQSPHVIVGPLSTAIRDDIRDARVLILGGGDNALDHALFLAERGNRATVCTRGRFSARRPFLETCRSLPGVQLRDHCRPMALRATGPRISADWGNHTEEYDWLLVMFGYEPNTAVLACFAPGIRPLLTPTGHLHVDKWQRTTVAGIYAAGDLTDNPQPSVVTAISQGLAAAKAIERDTASG